MEREAAADDWTYVQGAHKCRNLLHGDCRPVRAQCQSAVSRRRGQSCSQRLWKWFWEREAGGEESKSTYADRDGFTGFSRMLKSVVIRAHPDNPCTSGSLAVVSVVSAYLFASAGAVASATSRGGAIHRQANDLNTVSLCLCVNVVLWRYHSTAGRRRGLRPCREPGRGVRRPHPPAAARQRARA